MKQLIFFFAFLFCAWQSTAQVSINDDNSGPDPSAMLDVKSSDKGFLPPRMTTSQMNGIVAPIAGLLVYNTSVNALYWFDGANWQRFNEFNYTETDPVFEIHPTHSITQLHIDQWNEAYSWGNHALAGYLTSYTETDPLFYAHPASWISTNDLDHWNQGYNFRLLSATGSGPLSLNLSSNQLTGNIQPANAVQSGYLTVTDWNTFNNKQSALTFGHVTSSDMTVTGGNNAVNGNGLNLAINKGNLAETYSSVLTITGGANAVLGSGTTIRVNQATSAQSGYLSSADWNTFNNKQNALTFGNLTSSDITVSGGSGAVKGSGASMTINKASLTSTDLTVTGGTNAVLGSGATLTVKKGNLTETGSSVLTITNGTNAVLGTTGTSIQVKPASATQSGYLSSADWNNFNDKVSSQWVSSGQDIVYQSGRVGVGTSAPTESAEFEVNSTTRGFLPPRMTLAQRDAIANPAIGLMIYCLDCPAPNNVQVFIGTTWNPMAYNRFPYMTNVTQTGGLAYLNVLTGSYTYNDADNDPQGTSLYQWYRAENTSGLNEMAIAGATNLTYTLALDDTSRYVRFAITPVAQTGASPGEQVKASGYIGPVKLFDCGNSVLTINHLTTGGVAPVDKTTTYSSVTNIPGETSKCWITKNLGATQQATAVSDATEASAGWYWQFNRKKGYKHDGSTLTPAWTITSINENSDWLTANDPCKLELGTQWRLPTYTEWYNVDNIGGWTNWNGPWGSGLKLHAAGYLYNSNGFLDGRGSNGIYWSSTQNASTNGWDLNFLSSGSNMNTNGKALGFSARCLRDN